MPAAPIPLNEEARLAALRSCGILDTLPEPGFDDLTHLASKLLDVPVALVSLVDAERQWFKSCVGLCVSETHRDAAFCAHAIQSEEPLVVNDALTDERFKDNPLVMGPPHIRFYAGAPLVTADGFALGTLCIIDMRPREISHEQLQTLKRLARQALTQLELRRSHRDLAVRRLEAEQLAAEHAEQRLSLEAANAALEEAQTVARLGYWSFDAATGQTEWSRQVYAFFGRDPGLGTPSLDEAIKDYDLRDGPKLREAMNRALQTGESFGLLMRTRFGRNGVRYLWAEGRAKRNAEGAISHLFGTVSDVTEATEREEALTAAQELAEAASRSKTEFLANMSHEIRTPMTAILGYADLLAEEARAAGARAEWLEWISTIKRNGDHLLSIISDILDISKVEAGKMDIDSVPTCPEQLVREVLELMSVKAQAKGLTIEASFNDLPECIATDPVRLRQILMNLVGNAIKFTELGGVRIEAQREKDAPGRLRVDVIDTGIGMDESQCGRLFQAFSQVDTSTTRRFGGTGLGLQISRRLARMLGGDIQVSSKPGEGSTFTLTFAAVEATGAAAAQRAETRAPAADAQAGRALENMRILLAEDGPDNQRLITHHLRRAGAVVRVVETGKLAIQALTEDGSMSAPLRSPPPFDVLLTDMQMPEMDGYAVARLLRRWGSGLPIVALTAHSMSGDERKCLDAGCDAYASKPIDSETLIATLRHVVSRKALGSAT